MVPWLSSGDKPPTCLALRSSSATITLTVSFAVFTDVFLYAVVVPVIPFTLESRIGVSPDRAIWGWMADRYQNRRIPMLVGLLWLLAATLLLCLSSNIAMLLIARILQGLSAAMTWSVGLALLIDSVDKNHVGRATGWTSTALTLGILLGPLIGGIVYDRAGNYAVFGICFGLIGIDIILRLLIIEAKDARKWMLRKTESDAAATAELTASAGQSEITAAPQSSTIQASRKPGIPEEELNDNERRKSHGAFSIAGKNGILGLLRKRRMLCALFGVIIQAATQTSFDAIMPLQVHEVFHWDAIGGGLIFLPIVLPTFFSPLIGSLGDKYGPRWFTAGGFLFCVPFLVCFRFVTENTINHKVMLCGLLFAVGLGEALQVAPLMAEISWAADEGCELSDDGEASAVPYAQAYALYNISFAAGAIIGPLLSGMVRESAGFGTVGWSLAILNGVTALVMLNWVGGAPLYRFRQGIKRGGAGGSQAPSDTGAAAVAGAESGQQNDAQEKRTAQ
ncbi:Major facilitator superfamily domain, general substrate transporter [Cordyceps fumosorosea ARSEF 2679]|uniref:Major facilitator superfamily domain, general substrate transporter n=1 Tax=Cordyceps fumosorosea (strain ARSEF 2679) TaxID=1081104 RepID=A0A168CHF6_CORFA|nr:Major facilitator superfamily domain, general substrate transporter [Cordyceps fumosorosea ARSEF 2679]OAA71380.1 Major facilitator superfamily domain, general substrate transporter [Cordyceps fumosorosea ARSEF 2679]